jgi:Fic family protein
MKFKPEQPYNDLPLLPPETDIETKKILKKSVSANRALAELKGAANSIPNPEILITSITLQEAKSSSAIENVVTTNDKLFKAFAAQSQKFDAETKEVLRYREALWEGFNELCNKEILTTNLFIKIFQKIKETNAGIRKTPGTKLTDGNGKIIYSPPEGEQLIRKLLHNLEEFIHDDKSDIDPLIKSAIIHYQFESIHPFTDGNGRTGRIILILYFVLQKYLSHPILYLSRYIIDNKTQYYKFLRGVTENNDWESWILYILDGVEVTSKFTTSMIEQIYNSLHKTNNRVKKESQSRIPKEVIELIYEQPYCKTDFIINKDIAKRKAAERYLKELERMKILRSEKIGKEVIYRNIPLYNILTGKRGSE